jgi:hypothetical protein
MAENCKGLEYKVRLKQGLYGSDWFESDSESEKGKVIDAFILAHFKKNEKAEGGCAGDCKESRCLPTSFTIKVPEGAGTFKKATTEEGGQVFASYLLVLKEACVVSVSTECDCIKHWH